jgi:hypothetical protein
MKLFHGLLGSAFSVMIIFGVVGAGAFAGQSPLSAETFYNSAIGNSMLNQPAGESWAWNATFNIDYFMYAYRACDDPAWLKAGVKYYDFILSHLQKGPDGYLGWIGPYIYDTTLWSDVHISDAILYNAMLDFAEIVLKDAELEKVYGEKARHYVQLAEVHMMEK